VGIGTDAPLAPLNIGVDSATASPIRAIKLGAGTTVVGNGQYIQFSTSTVDSLGSQIQGVRAGAGASSDLRFLTTNTSSVVSEKMRIDSSGKVGIGTATLNTISGTNATLTLGGSGISGGLILQTAGTDKGRLYESSNLIIHQGMSSVGHSFYVNASTEAMRIDSSGKVGIGTDTVLGSATRLHVKVDDSNTDFSLGTPYHLLIENDNTTTNTGAMLGLRADTADGGIALHYGGSANVGYMTFHVDAGGGANSERMRIDSSGDVLVGKTTVSLGEVGVEVKPNGEVRCTTNGAQTLQLNRLTSDGTIVDFRKDSTVVGSIGTFTGYTTVGGNTNSGLIFRNGEILPWNNGSTAYANGTQDLGDAAARFKDLYLSGSVYLGGTTSANALDDYEEGTWTPVYAAQTGSFATMTMFVVSATYTKIGRQVTVRTYFYTNNVDATGASGDLRIGGLPFTVGTNEHSAVSVGYARLWSSAPDGGYANPTTTNINLQKTNATANSVVSDLTTGATAGQNVIIITATYFV
jgi:hypothetical protein